MQLAIQTFSNRHGGNSFYKAVSHPVAARGAAALLQRLGKARAVAVYDPLGFAGGFAALHDLGRLALCGVFVQDVEAVGSSLLGHAARPIGALAEAAPDAVLVAAFDAERLIGQIRDLVPAGAEIVSFDALRLPDSLLTNRRNYLDPLNFATNFAFFRDEESLSTRLVTANYWAGYGAREVTLALTLFDAAGRILAEWQESVGTEAAAIVIDSRDIRRRFALPAFTGQLFLHVVGAAGHDVVKYALDTVSPDGATLSCTHDANAWPADFYAGLPAPAEGERVILWVQNSHPCAIPAGAVSLNLMGRDEAVAIDAAIPPFASRAVDVAALFPEARWPAQIEIAAGRYIVRPRYEVVRGPHRRIAHVNVERTDLEPDPRIAELGPFLGKGFLLPAPVLPLARWRSIALPTPMARGQRSLPIAAILYDAGGKEMGRHAFGRLRRAQSVALAIDEMLGGAALEGGFGHLELVYDFAAGREADGWLHGLFRYEAREGGHAAETSFGAHVFNTVMVWKGEPQSYAGRPPGLSTRLFLRLGTAPLETLCHLIYPASARWRPASETDLVLHRGDGGELARRRIAIPCSGSLFWRASEMFEAAALREAGASAYVVVRDTTCRLFGYHGLLAPSGAFSLDHMFGF